jgi:hypothetical protein
MNYPVLILFTLFFSFSSSAAEMTLYFTNPPKPLNWKTPRSLSLTTARNSLGKDYAPIGHVNVRLKCEAANAHGISHILTGMSREDRKESQRLVKKYRLGLATFFYDFKGTLDKAEVAQKEIDDSAKDKRLNGLKIQISEDVCQKLLVFVDEWIKNGSYEHYGASHNTSIGEGAGCAAFAVEFMKLAGLEKHTDEWFRVVIVPHKLIGTKSHKVSLVKMGLTKQPWGKSSEDGPTLKQFDPELMNDWVEKLVKAYQETSEYKISQDNGVDFIELDASKVKPVSDALPLLSPPYKKKSRDEQVKQWSAIKVN